MRTKTLISIAFAVLFVGCTSTTGIRSETQTGVATTPDHESAQKAMTPPLSNDIAAADNPTVTDPDKYKAVMENKRVRVLRYHDEPGDKTNQHSHPDSLLYALSAFRRRLIFPDGTMKERDFEPGDVMWIPAQTHVGENIGSTATEVLLIEMKQDQSQCHKGEPGTSLKRKSFGGSRGKI
jgi:quercetin dioxygenase-like cupin family protein